MKYILIEHGDDNKKFATVFETLGERVQATREAILGPDNEGEPCPELVTLADEGIVHFEGDPPLEWIDAEVSWPAALKAPHDEPKMLLPGNAIEDARATGRAEGMREAADVLNAIAPEQKIRRDDVQKLILAAIPRKEKP